MLSIIVIDGIKKLLCRTGRKNSKGENIARVYPLHDMSRAEAILFESKNDPDKFIDEVNEKVYDVSARWVGL